MKESTSNTAFDTFPWPQNPDLKAVDGIAKNAQKLQHLRRELMEKYDLSLRDLYRSLDLPGTHPLKDAQWALDGTVRQAYGMSKSQNPLEFLLALNEEVFVKESSGKPVTGPGLPSFVKNPEPYITNECISMSMNRS